MLCRFFRKTIQIPDLHSCPPFSLLAPIDPRVRTCRVTSGFLERKALPHTM
jgi:hypothetical protein